MKFFSRFNLVPTVTATTTLVLLLALAAVSWAISSSISDRIAAQSIEQQDANLRVAAEILSRDMSGTTVTYGADGNVERVVMDSIPAEFTDHTMIDTVGRVTDETLSVRPSISPPPPLSGTGAAAAKAAAATLDTKTINS